MQSIDQLEDLRSLLSAGRAGLLHPLITPAHAVALAALALIADGNRRSIVFAGSAVEIAFAVGLAIGLGALARSVGETPASDVLLAGATLCGLLAASGVTVPVALSAPGALLSGIAVGLDSPPVAVSPGDATAAMIGTACGGVAALALTVWLASWMARPRHGVLLRVAGSWIAAIALLALVVRWGGAL